MVRNNSGVNGGNRQGNKPELTEKIACEALQKFFDQKPFVLFASGVSCAVDRGFGMKALQDCLEKKIPEICSDNKQKSEWKKVSKELELNSDFEMAMNGVEDKGLMRKVIETTAEHLSKVERENAFQIFSGEKTWPAIGIIKRLVERLPETDRTLHAATPNYDLLAEYALIRANIPYTTGFWGGVVRRLDWDRASRQMTYREKVRAGRSKVVWKTRYHKHLRLYKVHGSLNTFWFEDRVVETDAWRKAPENVERLMITPGTSKHEKLHRFRDDLLSEFDKAVRAHNAFLFLGFGFNDTQLVDNAIVEKLRRECSPALIVTRSCNERIEKLVRESTNAWLVCKQADDDSTRIFNGKYRDWLHLPGRELWKFDRFAEEIMGG